MFCRNAKHATYSITLNCLRMFTMCKQKIQKIPVPFHQQANWQIRRRKKLRKFVYTKSTHTTTTTSNKFIHFIFVSSFSFCSLRLFKLYYSFLLCSRHISSLKAKWKSKKRNTNTICHLIPFVSCIYLNFELGINFS